jgi:acylphosphatase
MKAAHATISGMVQGVAFRQTTRREARQRHLHGWVRNLRTGEVEVFAQGAEDDVNAFIDWLWTGPPTARVTGVESDTVEPDPNLQDFLITN